MSPQTALSIADGNSIGMEEDREMAEVTRTRLVEKIVDSDLGSDALETMAQLPGLQAKLVLVETILAAGDDLPLDGLSRIGLSQVVQEIRETLSA